MSNHQPDPTAIEQLVRLAERHETANRNGEATRLYHQAARLALEIADHSEALALTSRALTLATDGRPAERFALLFERERLHGFLGQRAAQQRDLASLEALAAALNDDSRRALVAARQAEWRLADGDPGAAISLATLALRLARVSGADGAAAAANLTLGRALLSQARFDRARHHLQQAAVNATELGDSAMKADALRTLGVLCNDSEQFQQALTYFLQAEALYAGAGDQRGRAMVLNNRGHVHAHQGQLGQALQAWQKTARLFEALEDIPGRIRVLLNLGALHIDLGQYDDAERQLTQALAAAEKIQLAPGICYGALNLGLVAVRQGRFAHATERLRAALQHAQEMGAERLIGFAWFALGQANSGLNDLSAAGDAYWEALAIWEALGLPNLAAEARAGLARIAHVNNAPSLALGFVETILAQLERDPRLEGTESPVEIFLTSYHVLEKAGDARAADMLTRGSALLQARLASIQDESARQALIGNIRAHRELLSLAASGG